MSDASLNQKIELKWLDPKDQTQMESFICKICLGIVNNPVLLSCGDIFCSNCFKSKGSRCINTSEKCQNATIISETIGFLHSLFEKRSCHCKNIGCKAIISITKLFDHFSVCPKEAIKCKYGCQTQDLRERIHEHEDQCLWKDTKCQDCLSKILSKDIETHNTVCPMKMISCVLCHGRKLRKDMSCHINDECEEYERECLYSGVDCQAALKVKDMIKHHEGRSNEHLKMYSDYLVNAKKIIELSISQCQERIKNTIDGAAVFLVQAEQNRDAFQLNEEMILEEEEKELTIGQNNMIDSLIAHEMNEENDDPGDNESKRSSVIKIRRRRKGRRRARGIRRFKNKKAQTEFHDCLVTHQLFSTTKSVQVTNKVLFVQTPLSISEMKHSPFHIILYNSPLDQDSAWVITPIDIKSYFYFGVCVKEMVSNANISLPQSLVGNHGFFGMSSSGYLFHSYSSFKNNTKCCKPLHATKDIFINFKKEANQLVMQFMTQENTSQEIVIPNIVTYFPGHSIVPCLLLTETDDQIKFDYK